MKSRMKRKLAKKAARLSSYAIASTQVLPDSIVGVAIGCWRIKQLLPEFAGVKKQPVLASTLQQMLDSLEIAGVEIEDPKGSDFREGLTLEVALFENTAEITRGSRKIVETLSPAIYSAGKLVKPARVIVGVGIGAVSNGTKDN